MARIGYESGTDRIVRRVLEVAVIGSVLAIGSVHVPALAVAGAVALVAGTLAIWGSPVPGGQVPRPALLLAALAAYTVVQATPIPLSWLTRIEPATAEIWARSATAIGERPASWAALSMDPGSSWVEALKWWVYAGVFVGSAAIGAQRGARWGASLLLVSGSIVALVTMAHGSLNATTVFGVYEPRFGGERWHIGPLINPNNLAGYLNLAALAGLGLLADNEPPAPRWLLGLSVATVLGASIIAASRGGTLVLVGGLILFGFLVRRSRQRFSTRNSWRRLFLPAVLTLVGGLVLAFIAATRQTLEALLQKDITKLQDLTWTLGMIRDHPWFGIGRGAFQSVFPQYLMGPNDVVFTHPENVVAQWLTEWGLLVGGFGLVSFSWLLRPRALGYLDRPSSTGIFVGLVALVAQNMVDLSSEVPGVMIAAVMGVACLWGDAAVPDPKNDAGAVVGAFPAIAFGAISAVLVVTALVIGGRTLIRDRDDAVIDFPSTPSDPIAFKSYRTQLRAAMHRHPAEPYFPRQGAVLAWKSLREPPLPWLELTLERGPMSGRTNYLLGVYLAQRGFQQQALMELRMAAEYASGLAPYVTSVALLLTHDPNTLHRVVPEGKNGAPVLYSLALKLPEEVARTRDSFLEEASGRDPDYVDSRRLLAERLLSVLELPDHTDRCVGSDLKRCAHVISEQCDALDRLLPDSEQPAVLRARLFIAVGHASEAARNLANQCSRFADRLQCLRIWLRAAATAHDDEMAKRAAEELEINGCAGQHHCANTYTFIGDTFLKAGERVRALGYFERAARADPLPNRWRRAADVAAGIGDALLARGDTSGAITYSERAANEDPNAMRWRHLADLKKSGDDQPPPAPPPIDTSHGPPIPQEAQDAIRSARAVSGRAPPRR